MTDVVSTEPIHRQRTLLLVDDEPDMNALVEAQLRAAGLDVACTSTTALMDGLAAASDLHPDLVVLDHHFAGDDRTGSDAVDDFKRAGARMVLLFTASIDLPKAGVPSADAVLEKLCMPLLPATVSLLLTDSVIDLRDPARDAPRGPSQAPE